MKKALRQCHRLLLRLHRWTLRNPFVTLALAGSILLFFSFQLPKLKTILAMEDVVDSSFASKQHLDELRKNFRLGSSMNLLIEKPIQGWDDHSLCAIHTWLVKQKISSTDIVSSFSIFDLRKSINTETHLQYPRLLPLSCLSDESLGPLNQSEIEEGLKEAQHSPFGPQTISSEQTLNLQIDLHEDEADSKTGSFNPLQIENRQRSFATEVASQLPGLSYHWVGPSDLQHYLFIGLKRVNVLNLFLLVFLLVGFRCFFGTWKSGIIYGLSLILTATACLGAMAFFHIPMDILSKSLFLMISVAALEDFLFLSFLRIHAKSWRAPFRELMLPGFLTSFTTAMGFGSLMISNLQIIRRFGFWAATASMVEWFLVFIALPALMKLFPSLQLWTSDSESRLLMWVKSLKFKSPARRWTRLSLVFFPLAIMGFLVLNINDVPSDMFSQGHLYKNGLERLKQSFGWEAQVSLVFENSETPLRASILKQLANHPMVVSVIDPHLFIDWFQRGVQSPTTKTLIESEIKSARFFENFFSPSGASRVPLLINRTDSASVSAFSEYVDTLCLNNDCYITGVPVVYAQFSNLVPKTLLESFLLSIVMVGMVLVGLAASVGQLAKIGSILISSFWGLAVMFFIIGAGQIKVNFLTCIFASILVGLAGDNAIQFLCAKRKTLDQSCLDRGEPALLCGLFMTACSLIFLGSYFVPPRLFGLLLAGGFLMSMVGDYWVLRSLMKEKSV